MYKKIEFNTIDSTNTWAVNNIEKLEDKTVILSEIQTDGQGRFNRKWISNIPKNIYCTIVLKPKNYNTAPNITQYLSVIICKTLEKYNVIPKIKWPNDVQINNKKIAGILCKSITRGNNIKGLVLGFGINLNMSENNLKLIDQPATSLNIELQKEIDKNYFIDTLLKAFFNEYEKFLNNGFIYIKDEYEKRQNFFNRKVKIINNMKEEICTAKKIDDKGNLIVIDHDKKEKSIITGDLFLI